MKILFLDLLGKTTSRNFFEKCSCVSKTLSRRRGKKPRSECVHLKSCFTSVIPGEAENVEAKQFRGFDANNHQRQSKKPKITALLLFKFIKARNLSSIFANLQIILRVFLSTAVTNCSGERPYSVLKRVKNVYRSAM